MANYNQESNVIVRWLKVIFSWKVITGILTIVTSVWAWQQFKHNKGGELSAYIDNTEIYANEKTDIVVFVDKLDSDLSLLPIVPIPQNNKEYSVRDFLLQYQVSTKNISYTSSDFYSSYQDKNGYTLRYNETVLYPFTSAEEPIIKLCQVDNDGSLMIRMRATYDGISKPYIHDVNARFCVVPKSRNISFYEWKNICERQVEKRTDALKFNAYYLADNQMASSMVVTASAMSDAVVKNSKPQRGKTKPVEIPISTPVIAPEKLQNTSSSTAQMSHENNVVIKNDTKECDENSTILITGIDTLRLADNTLVVDICFEPVEKECEVCFVSQLIYEDRKRYDVFLTSISPNAESVRRIYRAATKSYKFNGVAEPISTPEKYIYHWDNQSYYNGADFGIICFADEFKRPLICPSKDVLNVKDCKLNNLTNERFYKMIDSAEEWRGVGVTWKKIIYTKEGYVKTWYKVFLACGAFLTLAVVGLAIMGVLMCVDRQ